VSTRSAGFPLYAPRLAPNQTADAAIPAPKRCFERSAKRVVTSVTILPCQQPPLRSIERERRTNVAHCGVSLQIARAAARFRTAGDECTKALVLQAQNAFSILRGDASRMVNAGASRAASIESDPVTPSKSSDVAPANPNLKARSLKRQTSRNVPKAASPNPDHTYDVQERLSERL
jgi:hypothetical protein